MKGSKNLFCLIFTTLVNGKGGKGMEGETFPVLLKLHKVYNAFHPKAQRALRSLSNEFLVFGLKVQKNSQFARHTASQWWPLGKGCQRGYGGGKGEAQQDERWKRYMGERSSEKGGLKGGKLWGGLDGGVREGRGSQWRVCCLWGSSVEHPGPCNS